MKKKQQRVTDKQPLPLTQRKIENLLSSVVDGEDFYYTAQLNPKVGFKQGELVYLTEKLDGTTVQATNRGVYKRFDNFASGAQKRARPVSERYRLELLNLEDPQNKHIAKAVENYTEVFAQLDDGVCVYFEAIGTHINKRFQHFDEFYDIRVFDFAREGQYVPFSDTIALAEIHGLPYVHYSDTTLQLPSILDVLSSHPSYNDLDAPLEGYVVRSAEDDTSDRIAKIRVDDLANMRDAE
eukprot:GILK01008681.1.p1 GENE.GILK01008681.1~~GILK01008681.1.p1  ORF type:complete len:239 (-),score=35.71 GILK01008681.1:238-954(-)